MDCQSSICLKCSDQIAYNTLKISEHERMWGIIIFYIRNTLRCYVINRTVRCQLFFIIVTTQLYVVSLRTSGCIRTHWTLTNSKVRIYPCLRIIIHTINLSLYCWHKIFYVQKASLISHICFLNFFTKDFHICVIILLTS